MNEKIIQQLLDYMNETRDFLLQETPEIFQEILIYEKWLCIFTLGVFIPLLILGISIFIYNWLNLEYEKFGCLTSKSFITSIISGMLIIFSFILNMDAATSLIKINTAPRYFIIKKIVNLKN